MFFTNGSPKHWVNRAIEKHSSQRSCLFTGFTSFSSSQACQEILSTQECVEAILSRWGALTNTFKHLKGRHAYHYHPGFKKEESEHQEIANPVLKEKWNQLAGLKKKTQKASIELSQTENSANKEGTPRKNNKYHRLKEEIAALTPKVDQVKTEIKTLPGRVSMFPI